MISSERAYFVVKLAVMLYNIRLALFVLILAVLGFSHVHAAGPLRITHEKVCVFGLCDSGAYSFLSNRAIYEERWDVLPQTRFWRKIIRTSPDTGYINLAGDRNIFIKMSSKDWMRMDKATKAFLLDSIQTANCLGPDDQLVFTAGKSDFYKIGPVLSSIDRAVKIFEEENTDPFYAQAIILIESPGRLQKSTAGAYGPFQLMRTVAQRLGLKVNKYTDERKDFNKSAWAAAKLIRTICLPETRYMLDKNGIKYNENDLWFRLLVLHVYHAGAGNVAPVLDKICPSEGNQELIKQIWQTSCGCFRNASQNYSQLAIASLLELDALILNNTLADY
jgi:hypothetical protein